MVKYVKYDAIIEANQRTRKDLGKEEKNVKHMTKEEIRNRILEEYNFFIDQLPRNLPTAAILAIGSVMLQDEDDLH